MSTQIDPVTGAPLLTPDLGNIDQLPYSVQPVPLADQTNQPQLGRPYLYPDDVPPVLANINAMNGNQQDQAQTLHTDGNHRLLVASSGGSGPATSPVTLPGNWTFASLSSGSGQRNAGQWDVEQYLCGINFAWYVDPANSSWPVIGSLTYGLTDSNGDWNISLFTIGIYAASATSGDAKSGTYFYVPYPALDVVASGFNSIGGNMGSWVENDTTGDLMYNAQLIVSGIT